MPSKHTNRTPQTSLSHGSRPHHHALAALVAAFAVLACDPEDEAATPRDTSCEAVAAHVEELCGPVVGALWAENIRQIQCDAVDGLTLSQPERLCTLASNSCGELAERECAPGMVVIACSLPEDCPAPLRCDTENEECARCLSDSDCGTNEGCAEGLCIDIEAPLYKTSAAGMERIGVSS